VGGSSYPSWISRRSQADCSQDAVMTSGHGCPLGPRLTSLILGWRHPATTEIRFGSGAKGCELSALRQYRPAYSEYPLCQQGDDFLPRLLLTLHCAAEGLASVAPEYSQYSELAGQGSDGVVGPYVMERCCSSERGT
jgi:hypothetical protein